MERTQLSISLSTPQFSVSDMLRVVDCLNDGTLQSWLNRKLITTMEPSQYVTGQGKPRLLSVLNVVQIASMAYLSKTAIPLHIAAEYGKMAAQYLYSKAIKNPEFEHMREFMLNIWEDDAGEWQQALSFRSEKGDVDQFGKPDTKIRPFAFIVFAVDDLITFVAGRLAQIVEEREKLRRSRRFPAGVEVLEAMKPLAAQSGARNVEPARPA